MTMKLALDDLGLSGGKPLFEQIKSVSNLVRPDIESFLSYSRQFFDAQSCTGHGPVEAKMERRLAEFHGTRNCVSFCGGFWGLVLTMKCLALPGRTEVVMPSLTYRRLADIVAWAGLTPHFCEVDPDLLCVTGETAAACINENTALILGVHPIVNCCDIDGLEALSERTGIPLMIDAVESVYESYKGRKIGSCARAECFSMQSSKLFNAFEGGYVTTNDDELAQRLRTMRDFGVGAEGIPVEACALGVQQNEMHAAMALACLDDVDEQMVANRNRYYAYRRYLADVPGIRLREFDETERCGFKNILVELLDDWPLSREATIALLNAENMLCRPYYSPPLHMKATGYPMVWGDLTQTERLAKKFLLLPCGYFVSEADIEQIALFLAFIQKNAQAITQRGLV
ncbi:aminotransferase class I/II-fold pyridoxal phosphate-dependent enzyme [Herbaspirillum sp.]|uniref:aminotransferase class I/II-fold pyridoxal phosphate-dependent enzyme n=1 Tax=Herbaspirillum sp. TaxID=1890675 RepID=UPI001B1CDF7E|nr:aminotransferase class I/II-fold pyridoxal phosphate-dependent enzyme [Herbaspirillum sp.]MBO9536354.1 aminotransferase class I/II-fold pyridoxal phosphate-dependent enzyme [Herbaspirillum sp.]